MKYIQGAKAQIVLLLLSLLGAAISIYLTSVHYENVPLVCSTSGAIDCARVLSSTYSVVPGTMLPVSIPGLGWCVVSAILAIAGWRIWQEDRRLLIAQCIWTGLALLTVLYLVYAEIVRIRSICLWCTTLHVIILIMFLITLLRLQQPTYDLEVEAEDEAPRVTVSRNKVR